MPIQKNDLKDSLARHRQIKISVIGRKSGQTISIPVWYKNVLRNPQIRIDARGTEAGLQAVPVTDAKAVKSVVEKFREKYGMKDLKKYYSKFDVAVVVEVS